MDLRERMEKLMLYARKLGIHIRGYNINMRPDYNNYLSGAIQEEMIRSGHYSIEFEGSCSEHEPIAEDIQEPKVQSNHCHTNFGEEFVEKINELQDCMMRWGQLPDFDMELEPTVMSQLKMDMMTYSRYSHDSYDPSANLTLNGPGGPAQLRTKFSNVPAPDVTLENIGQTLAKIREVQKTRPKKKKRKKEEVKELAKVSQIGKKRA